MRIIAGNAAATAGAPADNRALGNDSYIAHWYCAQRGSTPTRLSSYDEHVPECPLTFDAAGRPNTLAHYVVRFPSCWDGVSLDSPDHKSHMAYPEFGVKKDGSIDRNAVVCPATHPVPLPEVSYHYSFTVTPENADPISKTSKGWRLASDGYAVGDDGAGNYAYGGHSLHGDWFNAWHPEVIQAFIDGCLKQRKDCHKGELGAPAGDGVYYLLGAAQRDQPAAYPILPNTDMSGMPIGMSDMKH